MCNQMFCLWQKIGRPDMKKQLLTPTDAFFGSINGHPAKATVLFVEHGSDTLSMMEVALATESEENLVAH